MAMTASSRTIDDQILTFVCRPVLDRAASDKLRALVEHADWPYLLEAADRHFIIPRLHHHLSTVAGAHVPPAVRSKIRAANESNAHQTLILTGELITLLSMFEHHGIQAIPWKGPTLATLAYGEVGLRQFADLDILVSRNEMPRLKKLLTEAGLRPQPRLTKRQEDALLRFDCALNFFNEKILVDVHWAFSAKHLSLTLNPEECKLQPVMVGQKRTRTLAQEDLLLALSIHGFTHYWERLGWVADIGGLIERNSTDWNAPLSRARQSRLRRVLAVTLLLTHNLLGTPIPAAVLNELNRDRIATELALRFQTTIFCEHDKPSGTISVLRLHMRIREKVRDKIATLLHFMFTPRATDWIEISISPAMSFIYYLVRPVRLVFKYLMRIAQWSTPRQSLQTSPEAADQKISDGKLHSEME